MVQLTFLIAHTAVTGAVYYGEYYEHLTKNKEENGKYHVVLIVTLVNHIHVYIDMSVVTARIIFNAH